MDVAVVLIGLLVSLGVGHVAAQAFFRLAHRQADVRLRPMPGRLPPAFTGLFERSLMFVVVATNVPDPQNVAIAWLLAKLASNWQRAEPDDPAEKQRYRTYSQIALMTGIVSLAFGYVGGEIANNLDEAGRWINSRILDHIGLTISG